MLKFSPKIRLGMLINVMLIKKNMYYVFSVAFNLKLSQVVLYLNKAWMLLARVV